MGVIVTVVTLASGSRGVLTGKAVARVKFCVMSL